MKKINREKIFLVLAIIVFIIIAIILISNNTKEKDVSKYAKQLANDINNVEYDGYTTKADTTASYYTLGSGKKAVDLQSRDVIFEIFNIVDNYLNQVNQKNVTELMNIIDSDYIKNNNLNANNIMSVFSSYKLPYYIIKKISYVEDLNYIVRFYDESSIGNNNFDTHIILIKLDYDTKSYSIIPNFDDTSKDDEKYLTSKTIERNTNNEYSINGISDEEVGIYFLKLFKKIYDNNIDYAYELVSQDLSNSIKTKEEFKNIMDNKDINYNNVKVTAKIEEKVIEFEVIDGNNNYFKFTVYPNYIEFYVKLMKDNTKGEYSNIYKDYNGSVSNEDISVFMDDFINNSVAQIKNTTSGLSYNQIRKYYSDNTTFVNSMGIYSAENFLNLSNQIVGMRWSKGIQYINYVINDKNESDEYLIYDITLEYTQEANIKIFLCIAKDSNTNPKIKIETTGVEED